MAPFPRLLVLDVKRLGREPQKLTRRKKRFSLLRIVVIEELESGELYRLRLDVIAV
jgi:hypothetical protein